MFFNACHLARFGLESYASSLFIAGKFSQVPVLGELETLLPPAGVLVDGSCWTAVYPVELLDSAQFQTLQHALAQRFQTARSTADLEYLMRLPGFVDYRTHPTAVRCLRANLQQVFESADVMRALGIVASELERPEAPVHNRRDPETAMKKLLRRVREAGGTREELFEAANAANDGPGSLELQPGRVRALVLGTMRDYAQGERHGDPLIAPLRAPAMPAPPEGWPT